MFPFYDQRFWGLHKIDPPPVPAWDKSNWHKLKEPLKTVGIFLCWEAGWLGFDAEAKCQVPAEC